LQPWVAASEAGGLSQRAFCAQHGIAVGTLRHWREPAPDALAGAASMLRQGARLILVQGFGEEPCRVSGVTPITAADLSVASPPELMPQTFRDLVAADKKVQDGRLCLVLLQGIGTNLVNGDFDPANLVETLSQARQR